MNVFNAASSSLLLAILSMFELISLQEQNFIHLNIHVYLLKRRCCVFKRKIYFKKIQEQA